MQPEYTQPPVSAPEPSSKKRRVILVVIVILSVVMVAALTVVALYLTHPRQSDVSDNSDPPAASAMLNTVDSPDAIIKDYAELVIKNRDELYEERTIAPTDSTNDTTVATNEPITHPTNGVISITSASTYGTTVSANDYIQYVRREVTQTKNDESVQAATESFLIDKGLIETSSDTLSKDVTLITYDSANTLCQITDSAAVNNLPASYGLACIAKQVVDDKYTLIDSLISLTDEGNAEVLSITSAPEIVENSKRLITLTRTTSEGAEILYFATMDSDWEYIGKRTPTNPDDQSSFALPEDLSQEVNDQKWEGFLAKYIQ